MQVILWIEKFCLAIERPTVVWHQAKTGIVSWFDVRPWKNQSNYCWI